MCFVYIVYSTAIAVLIAGINLMYSRIVYLQLVAGTLVAGRTDPMWTADSGQYFVSVLVSTVPLILFIVIYDSPVVSVLAVHYLFGLSTYCFHLIVWVGKGMDHLRILHRKLLI